MIVRLIETEFEKFKSIPFPSDSSDNEELADIFTDLVLFDGYVAGAIDRLIVGQEG